MRLEVKQLFKAFSTPVLKGVDLQIAPGSIRGLVGENGAGKSTLINILSGLLPKDEGQIFVDGQKYDPKNMRSAMAAGFSLAAQELSLIENLSVAENILLKSLPRGKISLNKNEIKRQAGDLLKLVGMAEVNQDALVSSLSLAQKQLVELAKALSSDSKVLILDEPTAALTGPQADLLHEIIRQRAETGCSVIYVSHRLEDVLELCDSVSVLRDGEIKMDCSSEGLRAEDLIRAMSGQSLIEHENDQARQLGEARLNVKGLTTVDLPHPISFTCHRGEILGVAGLAGAGRSELLEAIYGLMPHSSGEVELLQQDGVRKITNAKQAVREGMGLVAEDRKTQGIFAGKPIALNTTIAGLDSISNVWGKLFSSVEQERVQSLIKKLKVKCDGPEQAIDRLSGGNQQKLLIGRWMHCDAQVLLLDEPTRGVDVGSKLSIHEQLRSLRDQGASMIVVSSELEELTALCDRILVLSERKLVATFSRGEWSHDDILKAAFSEHTGDRVA